MFKQGNFKYIMIQLGVFSNGNFQVLQLPQAILNLECESLFKSFCLSYYEKCPSKHENMCPSEHKDKSRFLQIRCFKKFVKPSDDEFNKSKIQILT